MGRVETNGTNSGVVLDACHPIGCSVYEGGIVHAVTGANFSAYYAYAAEACETVGGSAMADVVVSG